MKATYRMTLLGALWLMLAVPGEAPGQPAPPTWYTGLQVTRNPSRLYGLMAGYRPNDLGGGHLRLTAAYASTRPNTWAGSNELAEDRFTVSPAWHFRPDHFFDPYFQIDLGYSRYEIEEPDIFGALDNDGLILAVLVGAELSLWEDRIGLAAHAGYSTIQSSTVYPFVASLGVNYRIK